jgi:hypothetical protein
MISSEQTDRDAAVPTERALVPTAAYGPHPAPNIAIVVGATAEVVAAIVRLSLVPVVAGVRLSERAASLIVRLPVVGDELVRLNRNWQTDRAVIERTARNLTRASIDRVIDQVDIDAIAAQIDVDAILGRVDVVSLARDVIEELDVPDMIRRSSGTLAAESVEGLRVQGMEADRMVARVIDAVLRRKVRPTGPSLEQSADADALDRGPD